MRKLMFSIATIIAMGAAVPAFAQSSGASSGESANPTLGVTGTDQAAHGQGGTAVQPGRVEQDAGDYTGMASAGGR